MSVSLTKNLLFTVEASDNNKSYAPLDVTPNADRAIEKFIEQFDNFSSIRILRDQTVMARKTPKSRFLHAEWR